jgi:ABC-type uncharacterized transport system ATPase subunit
MLALEYAAVRHILTAPQIAHRTARYIDATDFDFVGLAHETETMSGGEALLVAVAHELWLAEHRVGLWDIVRRLDRASFERVVTALSLARGTAPAAGAGALAAERAAA